MVASLGIELTGEEVAELEASRRATTSMGCPTTPLARISSRIGLNPAGSDDTRRACRPRRAAAGTGWA